MSEGVFQVVQLGRQAAVATGTVATTIFPVDAGFMGFELDRATEIPDEDFGSTSRDYTGRGSHGVRWATAQLDFVLRPEDVFHIIEMHVAKVSGGTATGGTYTYTMDETYNTLDSSLKPYTVEYGVNGSTQDEWEAVGVICDELELKFDALSAPGNSMWTGSANLVAISRGTAAMTDALSSPGTLTTFEGHLTTFAEGAVGTAFASLGTASATLKQFSWNSKLNAVGRAYGGTADTASAIGRSDKGEIEFEALLAINSTTLTDIHDIYNVSGGIPTERRWRITTTVGSQSLTIDGRVLITKVDREDHEGERLYAVGGKYVYDATLAGRTQFKLVSNVTTIP
jgi:hypothetical protein